MILVWNGWGILALIIPVLGGVLGHQVGGAVAPGREYSFTALGVALAGILVVLAGRRLNGGNERRVAEYRARREAELHHLVENGAFMGLPGQGRPSSIEQARAEAAQLLDAETAQVRRGTVNRHTLFWVPMQWIGTLTVIGGIVAAITGATR